MVQTRGSVQLSMGAALLEGLIDADTTFSLRLLPDAEGKAREARTTSVREIFSLMEIQGNKVCLHWPKRHDHGLFLECSAGDLGACHSLCCVSGCTSLLVAPSLRMPYGGH